MWIWNVIFSMGKPALFLDRDGVLNYDEGYTHIFDETLIIPGSADLIRKANDKGWIVIIITNQSGIGRGLYSETYFHTFMEEMIKYYARLGASIHKYYFSPFYKLSRIAKYRGNAHLHKPKSGMLHLATTDFHIDLGNSILVGDKMTDIACGRDFGVGTLVLFSLDQVADDVDYLVISSLHEFTEDKIWAPI